MRRLVPVVALLCASLSCEDDTGTRLARTDFTAKADAICARSQAATREVDQPEDESLKEIARVLDETLPIQRDALAELGELDAPDDVEDDYERYLGRSRSALRDLADAHEAALDDDRDAYDRARRRATAKFADIRERARAAGLETCSGAG